MKNDELKIEHDIPIPTSRVYGMAAVLRKLKVGDSVVLPTDTNVASNAVRQTKTDWKFTCRKVEGGTRVWRIK